MAAMADQPVPAAGPLRPPAPARTVNIKIDASLTPAPKAVAALPEEPVPQTRVTEDSRDSASAQPAPVKIAPENNAAPVAAALVIGQQTLKAAGPAQKAIDLHSGGETPLSRRTNLPVPLRQTASAADCRDRAGRPNPAAPADGTGGALKQPTNEFYRRKERNCRACCAKSKPGASAADDFGPKALNDLAGGSNSDHSGQRQNSPRLNPGDGLPGQSGPNSMWMRPGEPRRLRRWITPPRWWKAGGPFGGSAGR